VIQPHPLQLQLIDNFQYLLDFRQRRGRLHNWSSSHRRNRTTAHIWTILNYFAKISQSCGDKPGNICTNAAISDKTSLCASITQYCLILPALSQRCRRSFHLVRIVLVVVAYFCLDYWWKWLVLNLECCSFALTTRVDHNWPKVREFLFRQLVVAVKQSYYPAITRKLYGNNIIVESAGANPGLCVNKNVIKVLKERNIEINHQHPKSTRDVLFELSVICL